MHDPVALFGSALLAALIPAVGTFFYALQVIRRNATPYNKEAPAVTVHRGPRRAARRTAIAIHHPENADPKHEHHSKRASQPC
jgi:hypothetical protein